MSELINKKILIGISGGIAAYKSAELVRTLKKQGADVQVCMTSAACEFITPLTMQALSGHSVHTDLLDTQAEAAMGHIELARWADLIMIAPASADLMARLAHGMANDLLTTLCLATESPIHLAPAMNRVMWANLATQNNAEILEQRGFVLHGPGIGDQACGETGAGRMLEALDLAELVQSSLSSLSRLGLAADTDIIMKKPLEGKHVLITAGPTREAIDPVRYITNRSSGKMGYAMAEAARDLGANVTLISGPVALEAPAGVERILVESAKEMYSETLSHAPSAQLFIASAAVADYAPKQISEQKIKKSEDDLSLQLEYNPDILSDVSHQFPELFCIGFAAETENLIQHATDKLKRKKLDMIIANPVGKNKGFDLDTNEVEIIWKDGQTSLPEQSKKSLANHIMTIVAKRFANHPVLV